MGPVVGYWVFGVVGDFFDVVYRVALLFEGQEKRGVGGAGEAVGVGEVDGGHGFMVFVYSAGEPAGVLR